MAWDEVWEKIFKNQEWGKYPSEDVIRCVARNFYKVENRQEIKILEIGCGTGANLWFVAKEGFSCYGIDGSAEAIKIASERINNEFPYAKVELKIGDFSSLPYEDNMFDLIIDNEAICCNEFNDSIKIYEQIHKKLKNGGLLYTKTFAEGSWGFNTGELVGYNAWIVDEGPLKGKGYSRFTKKEDIPKLLKGFSIKELEMVSRTADNLQQEVKEWVVIANKETY
ncbi:class I SAM-dependent methyltransferase [Bacillus sp. RG28]|uniref:Class I SAM-dependent methyltransferase n=1 Tax=Gottfriedia endophytica TaxID=2820819 RepID=A0A940NTZ2_9BACI|nr:class I SAM-dependent methyltransferase [Gottfriedia endophytica]MBP0726731.1 class I SAM-dependent methyltransferase [Gottfriedia endophytica]